MLADLVEWLILNLQEGDTAQSARAFDARAICSQRVGRQECLLQHDLRAEAAYLYIFGRPHQAGHGREGQQASEKFESSDIEYRPSIQIQYFYSIQICPHFKGDLWDWAYIGQNRKCVGLCSLPTACSAAAPTEWLHSSMA